MVPAPHLQFPQKRRVKMNFMYLKVEKNEKEMSGLKNSLIKFGLRPADWVIRPKSENIFRIENAETPEFYFEGVTKKNFGQRVWKRIYLRNI